MTAAVFVARLAVYLTACMVSAALQSVLRALAADAPTEVTS